MSYSRITLTVNDVLETVDVPQHMTLLQMLREKLSLTGTKNGCTAGECGACTVMIDGVAARACVIPAYGVRQRAITTLEGLGNRDALHPVQQAFIEAQAAQCGYCLNGMIMTTAALLRAQPCPDDRQIRAALSGNLCRCGTHQEILCAVKRAITLCLQQAEAAS